MRRINLFFIIFFVIIMSGCRTTPASDGTSETLAETATVADEIAELESISIETARETFYDLSLGNDNSPVAKVTANSFESSGTFCYVDKVDDEWYIGYVVLKDDIYYDIMKDSENKITVERYNKLNITESDIELNDNIDRIEKKYSLQNDNQTKDLFTLTRNISPSSVIDVLKQCKGKANLNEDDKKPYDIPQNIFAKYYNENGLNIDFKYLINDETGFKACAIEIIPEGYCLTVYDPVRDWFEVTIYPYLVCIETGDLKQYYLSDEADSVVENHFFICEIS